MHLIALYEVVLLHCTKPSCRVVILMLILILMVRAIPVNGG